MRLGNERESRNFEDTTGYSEMLKHLIFSNNVPFVDENNMVVRGAPGGYAKWLTDALKNLTPQDLYIMKTKGLSIEELRRFRAIQDGSFPLDTSAYPYKQPDDK